MRAMSNAICALGIAAAACAAATPAVGPLRVCQSNPRYFEDPAGKVVYLTGCHTWTNLQDRGDSDPPPVFDFNAYLTWLKGFNQNCIRMWYWENPHGAPWSSTINFHPMAYQRTGPGNAADGKPKFDLTKYNAEFFTRLRTRTMAARDNGFYVIVMLFQGWSIAQPMTNGNPWTSHPYNSNNNVNGIDGDVNNNGTGEETHQTGNAAVWEMQKAYIRKVIETVNDLDNVIYEVANESAKHSAASVQWQYAVINYVKQVESTMPRRHPVGMTYMYWGGTNDDLFASPADWISPNAELSGDGRKVILFDTDHTCGTCTYDGLGWECLFKGTNAFLMDPASSHSFYSTPNYDPSRRGLGAARLVADHIDLSRMTPSPSTSSSGQCLADATGSRVCARTIGAAPTLNLSRASGTLDVEWFNTATRQWQSAGTVQGGASRVLNPPFSGGGIVYVHPHAVTSVVPASRHGRSGTPAAQGFAVGIDGRAVRVGTQVTSGVVIRPTADGSERLSVVE